MKPLASLRALAVMADTDDARVEETRQVNGSYQGPSGLRAPAASPSMITQTTPACAPR
jgi:hypothetical protein